MSSECRLPSLGEHLGARFGVQPILFEDVFAAHHADFKARRFVAFDEEALGAVGRP